jgi:hypothetical protein
MEVLSLEVLKVDGGKEQDISNRMSPHHWQVKPGSSTHLQYSALQ